MAKFLRDYLFGKLLDLLIKGWVAVTEAQAEQIGQRVQQLEHEGHSKKCANIRAADEFGLLDAPTGTIYKMTNTTCPKGCK